MQISHIKISNILGINELELSPEGFTTITGANGQGKTSVLEAIKSVTQSGHDATLLRKGELKGETVLVLDDGTELSKTVTKDGSTTSVRRDGKKLARPSETIKALTDALSVNPVEFLRAPKKDRVKVLLESMPITADAERLTAMTRIPVTAAPGMHALHLIEIVRKEVYDDRTGTNRAVTEKESTINQLRLAMPDAPGGVEGDEDQIRTKIQEAQDAMRAEQARIDAKLATLRTESAAKIQGIKDALNAKITEIQRAADAAILELREKAHDETEAERAALADTEAKAARVRQKATDTCTGIIQPLGQAVAAITANRDASAKRAVTIDTIAKMETELEDLRQDAINQTKALADIDAYKEELLGSLPIPGVEVRDGEVFRNGVAFDRLNTSQQVAIAFEIAKLRAGDLKVVCLDGIELMDSKHFEELKAQAEASGMQVFVTKVSDGNFDVTTE